MCRVLQRPGRAAPIGDGPRLCVTRNGYLVACCASPDDLPALGVDMSRMAAVARW